MYDGNSIKLSIVLLNNHLYFKFFCIDKQMEPRDGVVDVVIVVVRMVREIRLKYRLQLRMHNR